MCFRAIARMVSAGKRSKGVRLEGAERERESEKKTEQPVARDCWSVPRRGRK